MKVIIKWAPVSRLRHWLAATCTQLMIKAFSRVMFNCNATPWRHLSVSEFEFRTSETIIFQHSRQEGTAYLKVGVLKKINSESPVLHVYHLLKVICEVQCVSVASILVHSTGILLLETLIACRADVGGCAKARVWSRLIAAIAGSNSAEGMGVCLVCLLCVVYVGVCVTNWIFFPKLRTDCVCRNECDPGSISSWDILDPSGLMRRRTKKIRVSVILSVTKNWRANVC
jgi:hypothetical protein